ncbi:MAG: thiamine phosphate synthase [Planctomycetes bacterium]|nr:thiamine phosphate synthase [Planctomycetota bacterium]
MDPLRSVRLRLADARLYLIFTPSVCTDADPLAVLAAVLPHVDMVQVRVKRPDRALEPGRGATEALERTDPRELYDWCVRVLELRRAARAEHVLVLANDRVDVARSLAERGLDGVHVGREDTPPRIARAQLGPDALIGWSTHSLAEVASSADEPVDYLGFGPIRATATKGYVRGLGFEAAWIASQAVCLPVFPIGGIGLAEAEDLVEVGRAAVSSAILCAPDPAHAASAIRAALSGDAP